MNHERHRRERGTAAALNTIYPPERAAQQRFDDLLDRLNSQPYKREGDSDAKA